MTDIILLFIAVVLAVWMGFLIPTLIRVRRAAERVESFFTATEEPFKATLTETGETMRNVREITENLSAVSRDVGTVSSAASEVAEDIRDISKSVERLTARASGRFHGLRAGMVTALEVLIRNLRAG